MIRNYLKIAVRNLLRQKGLAFINIIGLSIGLACFSLFLLYAVNEFSFDRFHPKADRLYRVARWIEGLNGREPGGDTYMPMPLGPALKAEFPEVEQAIRMRDEWGDNLVRAGGRIHRIGLSFADPRVFEVFNFPFLYGDPGTALNDLNNIVLTEKTAIELFGEDNPVGLGLEVKFDSTYIPFTVTGVMKNLPANSTIQFALLGNFQYLENLPANAKSRNNWNRSSYQTFVQLRPGSGLANDATRLRAFRKKYYPKEEEDLLNSGQWNGKGNPIRYYFQPLRSMHTDMAVSGGSVPASDPQNTWLMLAIAAGVLLIACINFTTLAIGRSAGRAREVGVRKVVGSTRKQLMGQFLTESLLLAGLSGVLGLGLAQLLLPAFNDLADRQLTFSLQQYPEIAWLAAGVVLVAGLVAGSYPALSLSGFRPVEVLKSKVKLGGANLFTKSLVSVQFILSIGLIISTLVILRQVQFMRSKNPGFNKENVVVVDAEGVNTRIIYPRFRQSVSGLPGVSGVASSELSFGAEMGWSVSSWDYKGQHKASYEYFVDPDFLDVLNIPLVNGRNFDPAIASDTINSVIVNETLVRDFGWTPQTAVGQTLLGYSEKPDAVLPVVIGVVRDFNFRPFREAVEPQLFHQFHDYQPLRFLVRLQPGDPSPALSAVEKTWNGLAPDVPFKYSFLDEDLNRFYRAEQRWSKIIGWAGGISIFLACLGLFGLAALAAVNRTKEIGIRRVLGASVASITALLSRDFVQLVVLAFAVATPLAWYGMHRWLENFSYRIHLDWWLFALAGLGALLMAVLTVGVQSLKASLANPVNSLRNE